MALPALALLLPFFMFKSNRARAAWWIWLPVGVIVVVAAVLLTVFDIPNSDFSMFLQFFAALATGLGVLWLMAPYVSSRWRFVGFLKHLALLAGASSLAYLPVFLGESHGWLDFRQAFAIILAVTSLIIALALSLSGWCASKKSGRLRFILWLGLWLLLLAAAGVGLTLALTDGSPDWGEAIIGWLTASGISLVILLPYLLLSFFQGFHRERFLEWFKLAGPPVPSPATGEAAATGPEPDTSLVN
jgi:hypothetical protein